MSPRVARAQRVGRRAATCANSAPRAANRRDDLGLAETRGRSAARSSDARADHRSQRGAAATPRERTAGGAFGRARRIQVVAARQTRRRRSATQHRGCAASASSQRAGIARVGRIDRRAARRAACRPPPCRARQRRELRPRRFRIDVVGRDRRDAAPVVDAGGDQLVERPGAAGWAAPGCSSPARTGGAPPRSSTDARRATARARAPSALPAWRGSSG